MQTQTGSVTTGQLASNPTVGKAKFQLAEVYDVRESTWLGKNNSFQFLTRASSSSQALVVKSDGTMRLLRGATRVLAYARRSMPMLKRDFKTDLSGEILPISAELRMNELLLAALGKFWKSQADGAKIGLLYFREIERKSEVVEKTLESSFKLLFAHRAVDTAGKDRFTHGWTKETQPRNIVFMTQDKLAQWQADIAIATARAKLDAEQYTFSVGAINDEIIRLSTILGDRAKAQPFDIEACLGFIQLGKTRIVFQQNTLDMMDVWAEVDGKKVASRDDLVSVRMPIEGTAGLFFGAWTYSELGSAGYEVFMESKGKTKGVSKVG